MECQFGVYAILTSGSLSHERQSSLPARFADRLHDGSQALPRQDRDLPLHANRRVEGMHPRHLVTEDRTPSILRRAPVPRDGTLAIRNKARTDRGTMKPHALCCCLPPSFAFHAVF